MSGHPLLRFAWLPLVAALGACSSPGTPSSGASLGLLYGDIKVKNATPGSAITGYLSTLAVAAGGNDTVGLYLPGSQSRLASGPYQLAAGALPNNEWRLATYRLNPQVDAANGSAFLVEVDAIAFIPGAQYRFGTRFSGLAGSQLSPLVYPEPQAPLGTSFNVGENVCLVKARFRLTGADVNALSQTAPITCVQSASIEEPPASGSMNQQARAAKGGLMRDDLSNTGAVIEMLFRDEPGISRAAFCSVTPPANSGFEVDDDGVAKFAGVLQPPSGSCADFIEQTIEVPVVRYAGGLQGLFDVHGETEVDARIVLSRSNAQQRTVAPPLVPAGQLANANNPWRLDGVQPGEAGVSAWALLRGGDVLVTLPHRAGANLPVIVNNGPPVVDLGSTFITRATPASGSLVLIDPSTRTELRKLATRPLPAGNFPWNDQWSFVTVVGDPLVQPGPNGGSGESASSFGRLRGTVPAADAGCSGITDTCALDYTVLLTGISPKEGPLDGSATRTTRYQYDSLNLSYGSSTAGENYQRGFSTIVLAENRLFATANPAAIALGPISACVGQVEYEVRIDSSWGTLYKPKLTGSGSVTSPNTRFIPSALGFVTLRQAEGMPKNANESSTAKVLATLPEGARYAISPSVTFAPASGGAPTTLSFPERRVPAGTASTLGCGQIAAVCEKINNPDTGASTLLSVGIGDQPQCRPDGSVALTVRVTSGTEEVDSLSYQVDGGPAVSLCGPCGPNPVRNLPPPGQPALNLPNGGTITISATSANGCSATYSYPITTACTVPVPKKYQLAYFDEGKLKVYDVRSRTPVAELATPAGAIRYSWDGAKLAVAGGGAIKVFDADNLSGPLLAAFPGQYADTAFSPVDNSSLATLAPAGSDYFLGVVGVGNTTLLGPVTVHPANRTGAAAVAASRPRLAWSPDGARLSVAYDTRTAAGERALRITEWQISGGQLASTPVRDLQFAFAPGEELRAFAYQTLVNVERYVVASSRAIYWIFAGQAPTLVMTEPIGQADVHRDGFLAFAPGGLAPAFLSSQTGGFESNPIGDLAPVGGLAVSGFPTSGDAVQPDPRMAVARKVHVASGANYYAGITLYALVPGVPGLAYLGGWQAVDPFGLAFRPLQP